MKIIEKLNIFLARSLSTKVTISTLLIFLTSIWSLSFYASWTLREDMQGILSVQQFSTVSYIAAKVNDELSEKIRVLEKVAGRMNPSLLQNAMLLQTFLEDRLILQDHFNCGIIAHRLDGKAIVEIPFSSRKIGINFIEVDTIASALKEGKSTIGRPTRNKLLLAPILTITVLIYDKQKKVIGTLSGVTDLNKSNFLDHLTKSRYGKGGYYSLVSKKYRLIVTSTDESKIMQELPAKGIYPIIDRAVQGEEGSVIFSNARGLEVLASAKTIPIADWYVAANLPTAEAFAPIQTMQQRMLLTAIFLTLITGGLTWWILRYQLSPILSAMIMLASRTDNEQHPQPLPITRDDEIGRLIKGFNRLLETLEQKGKALKESEARYHNLVADIQIGVLIQSSTAEILLSNQSALDLLGISEDQLLGKTSFDPDWNVIHEDGTPFPGSTHPVPQSIATRLPVNNIVMGVYRPNTRDRIWLLVNADPQLNTDGSVRQVVCTFGDITELKKAEEMLRKLSTAIEQSPTSVVITDLDGKIQYVNPQFVEVTGYSAKEAIGQNPRILQSGEMSQEIYLDMWNKLTNGQRWHGELLNKRKNGELYWEESYMSPVKNSIGITTHYVAVKVDITERKEMEKALKETEIRYRTIADFTSDWEYWVLPDGKFQYISPSCVQVSGYSQQEFYDNPQLLRTIVHPDDQSLYINHIHQITASGTREPIDFRIFTKSGESRWISHVCQTVYDFAGQAIGQRASNRDITDRKWVESALKISEQNFRTIFNSVTEVIFVHDADTGKIIEVNNATLKVYGYNSKEELLACDFSNLSANVEAYNEETAQNYIRKAINEGPQTFEWIARKKDGSTFWIEITLKKTDIGGKGRILAVGRDITERKETETKLKEISIRDPLTNVFNRRYIFERLDDIFSEHLRNDSSFSILIIDLDFFKNVNDSYGHQAGDFILVEFSAIIKNNLRPYDLLGRYGGEEFIVIFINAKKEQIKGKIEGLLDLIRNKTFLYKETEIKLTFSGGVSDSFENDKSSISIEKIIEVADRRLYEAKRAGRNRIVNFDENH